ncbi:uncharacterized protein LOC112638041 [Camponotus floridanus]|uniref:uncharacterized protein LOC112638041 n=1 Tax=Camponotus floridanus TaxID=104421 RepID=UPI000DC6B808|nr:uncharacterized protein LOC112638041 [Camponotus floridanus]
MILLEDSDLYAVTNCLKLRRVLSDLSKIWIQESIVQTFKWHFQKCFGSLNIPIHIFQSKQELLAFNTFKSNMNMTEMNIVSIWSEDIVAAKTLAESLNQDVVFINTHMDFCSGIILPYIDKYVKSLDKSLNLHQVDKYMCVNPIDRTAHEGLIYDLFYNGKWQTPTNDTYWIHNEILLANATYEDITKCAISAIDGFNTWSTMSAKSRMKILSNFVNILECNGKFTVSTIIFYWIKMSYICGSKKQYYQNERFEVIKAHKPQVICDPDLCTLAPYCDMFKISGIPPGVINLLSSENTNFRYDVIKDSTVSKVHSDLTIIKHIIISRK